MREHGKRIPLEDYQGLDPEDILEAARPNQRGVYHASIRDKSLLSRLARKGGLPKTVIIEFPKEPLGKRVKKEVTHRVKKRIGW